MSVPCRSACGRLITGTLSVDLPILIIEKKMSILRSLLVLILFAQINLLSSFRCYLQKAYNPLFSHKNLDEATANNLVAQRKLTELKERIVGILDDTLRHLQENQTLTPNILDDSMRTVVIPNLSEQECTSMTPTQIKDVMEIDVELKKLGYSQSEIVMLKDNVKLRLIDLQLQKPAQIPKIWLRRELAPYSRSRTPEAPIGSARWLNLSLIQEKVRLLIILSGILFHLGICSQEMLINI